MAIAELSAHRAFLLLRYTLITATGYLLLVENQFAAPSHTAMLLLAAALASNVIFARLPAATINSARFGITVVTADTCWITTLLVQSGHFNTEFFSLYFFVLLLAAIGENLRLIATGAVVVCAAYVYLLQASGGSWSLWHSPSLIRIPFLFTAAAFYGYLVERTRIERRRAEVGEQKRLEAEAALRANAGELAEQLAVAGSLARAGRELISLLDTPKLLDRLCQITSEELGSDSSETLLWRVQEAHFVLVAAHGLSPEQVELARLLTVARGDVAKLLHSFEHDDVVAGDGIRGEVLGAKWHGGGDAVKQLLMALRRGNEIIGVQVATWRDADGPWLHKQERTARGIAQLASMALANTRLIEELERANRVKSDFVASMSHELRTPLNLIIGYNDLLLDEEFGPLSETQADTLQRISKSSRELLALIEATLDLSRLESRRVPMELRQVQLPALFRDLEASFPERSHNPAVTIAWRLGANCPTLYTDGTKLKMILKNLVDNAVKFTERGSVSVLARPAGDGGVEFAVSDTGIGIAPEAHAAIFEPFRQADQRISAQYGGVGLGLFIVARLVDALGGTVRVQSEVGQGSIFHVWLPRCAPAANDAETAAMIRSVTLPQPSTVALPS